MTSTLFICRLGGDYRITEYGYFRKFSGLFNSARLVNEMLNRNGMTSHIEVAKDNNDIDRLVTKHKPDICIIEAYWVVPEKFAILHKLHPNIKWVIRIHSEVPFWATEGIALDWTLRYLDYPNVILAPNAKRLYHDLKTIMSVKYCEFEVDDRIVYLPNYYPSVPRPHQSRSHFSEVVNIGCFGAIRPLKNQLIQAIAAIEYADRRDLTLRFHINGNRIEGSGEPVLKNIENLFKNSGRHELIKHPWQPHHQFMHVLAGMDLGMQVSFTESFNIVAADMVTAGIPIITSPEIDWVSSLFHADPTNTSSMVHALCRANTLGRLGVGYNQFLLNRFSNKAEKRWLEFIDPNAC
jgi:hypothetical protein